MKKKFFRYFFWITFPILVLLVSIIIYYIFSGKKLQLWHTFVPRELTVEEMDKADWQRYIEVENKLFEDVHNEVVLKTPDDQKTQINRYYADSIVYPSNFKEDWNRSYILDVENPKGAVVMLHGLTDAPYSLRHIAKLYHERGFVVVGIRLPGHGTVPAALTKSTWQDWMAATRLAVREARRLVPNNFPLHIVGFSNGGALAVKYELDGIEDKTLIRADRIILISPMIGITRFARLAELIDIPSSIPGLEKTAWISIIPEFNPFKFNSFPVNAVRQARLLISNMQQQTVNLYNDGRLKDAIPILTFQSIADYTVSTPAIVNNLYAYLPNNGSELVFFDINQATTFSSLVRPVFSNILSGMLPELPQPYTITIIQNASSYDSRVVEKVFPAGEEIPIINKLDLVYPSEIFSLSHIALPFPVDDALYGRYPSPETKDDFGLNLGRMTTAQGEQGVLQINMNLFFRIASNPFFSYVLNRIGMKIDSKVEKISKIEKYAPSKSKMDEKEYDKLFEKMENVEIVY